MKVRNILSNTAVKVTLITSCAILLVGLGAFSALAAKAAEGKNDNINIEKATEIALNDANFTSSDVTKVTGYSENDDGRLKYEIRFIAEGKEYEYEINAKTGAIVDKSVDREEIRKPIVDQPVDNNEAANKPVEVKEPVVNKPVEVKEPAANKPTTLTSDQAKAIALKDANVTDVTFIKVQPDRDDGFSYYDIEFVSGDKEYDYEISAKTGAILEKNVERAEIKKPANNQQVEKEQVVEKPTVTENNAKAITVDQAKSIALKDANVTNASFVKAQLDRDDGISYYEIEFRAGGYEYEYEINASDGKIVDKNVDRDDD